MKKNFLWILFLLPAIIHAKSIITSDEEALDFCKKHENTRIVVVYPAAYKKDKEIKAIIKNYGKILYEKPLLFTDNGPFNFIRYLYQKVDWFGKNAQDLIRVQEKVDCCFPEDHRKANPVRIYLIELFDLDYQHFRDCKREIRALFNLGLHAVHSDHRHKDAVLYAQAVFCDNSLTFLNNHRNLSMPRFEALIKQYKQLLRSKNIEFDNCCIVGKAVDASYGITDCTKLEFVSAQAIDKPQKRGNGIVNVTSHYTQEEVHNLIFDAHYHFYFYGLKFAYTPVESKKNI